MTSTASFKDKFKQAFSFFLWELKSSSGILIIHTVLMGAFLITIFTLCMVMGNTGLLTDSGDHNTITVSANIFGFFGGNMIYYMTGIFTIIYTIKMYLYLHDKRQGDLYGSLPISRATLFFSKTATAFVFSIVPAIVFLGIVAVITLLLGSTVYISMAMLLLKLVIGSFACISAYGLIAICCGTTINSIIMFVVVCIAYPFTALISKGIVSSFFTGLYTDGINDTFIMNAFNPLSAYNGKDVIYWLIFTAVCLVTSAYLIKKRRTERAQSSFVYFLPCHIVKVLVSLLAGLFLGTLFGSFNVFDNAYLGFMFGFVVASVPTFMFCHLIFYRGFTKFLKTSVQLGVLILVVAGAMAVLCFDLTGYNSNMPKAEDIKSAGFVDGGQCFIEPGEPVSNATNGSEIDFDDKDNIERILYIQEHIKNRETGKTSQEAFINVWINMFESAVKYRGNDWISFSYKLNNGSTYSRVYYNHLSLDLMSGSYTENDVLLSNEMQKIIATKTYQEKYSGILNAGTHYLSRFTVTGADENIESTEYESTVFDYQFTDSNTVTEDDLKNIIEAYRKDFEADNSKTDTALYIMRECRMYIDDYFAPTLNTVKADNPDAVCFFKVEYDMLSFTDTDININTLMNSSFFENAFSAVSGDGMYVVPKSYTNTIEAMKKAGILTDKLEIDDRNPNNNYIDYYDDYNYNDTYGGIVTY